MFKLQKSYAKKQKKNEEFKVLDNFGIFKFTSSNDVKKN